jgi:dephospho-CoA kinase
MSLEDANARIATQATEAERVARADVRVDGSKDLADLQVSIANLWMQIQHLAEEKAGHGKN